MTTFLILAVTALIPTIVGFLYYNEKAMGGAWRSAAGIKADDPKPSMGFVMSITMFFSLLLSVMVWQMVIHQNGFHSMLVDAPGLDNPESELSKAVKVVTDACGNNYRTFKHGAFHGVIDAFFFALPVLSMSALYEGKSMRYIGVHLLYWIITLGLMGGVLCQFMPA